MRTIIRRFGSLGWVAFALSAGAHFLTDASRPSTVGPAPVQASLVPSSAFAGDDSPSTELTLDADSMRREAWQATQKFVGLRLPSPDTARWQTLSGERQEPLECVRALADGRFECRGWVDSRNRFGTMARTSFVTTVRRGGNGQWFLDAIE